MVVGCLASQRKQLKLNELLGVHAGLRGSCCRELRLSGSPRFGRDSRGGASSTSESSAKDDLILEVGSGLDADVHARRHVQGGQRVNRLGGRLADVDQALVRPDLELFTRLLVDER